VNYNNKLRNSPLYILTADLSFFYRVNKELNKLRIPFKILNLNKIIPRHPSIILTTSKEEDLIEQRDNNPIVLSYSEDDDFDNYIILILATVKIGYKKRYSELLFSVDPGKKTGLMIFLDGYYLYSYCCFKPSEVIRKIMKYIECFKIENQNDMEITFKLGNGVLAITMNLVKQIYSIYSGRKNIKIFIIDEFKSSKVKVNQKNKPRRVSKDELSALILALRDGVEINQNDYLTLIKQSYKNRKNNSDNEDLKKGEVSHAKPTVGEIALKVIDGDLTVKNASDELKAQNLLK